MKHPELTRALRRLEKSNTRLTRRRARNALRSAVNKLLREYPVIGKDGEEKRERKKPTCPICRIPMASWPTLANHLRSHCGDHGPSTCCCCRTHFKSLRALAQHLASLHRRGELVSHAVKGSMDHAFEEDQ